MDKIIFALFFIICLALKIVESSPIEGEISFIEGLNMEYENGQWTCGDVKCPKGASGCTIRIKSDESDKKVLYQSFNCMDSMGAGDEIKLDKEKSVDIEITSYVGAKSIYNIEYSDKGEEKADGFVPVEKLKELKEKFKELKRLVVEEKKPVAVFTQGSYPGKKINHRDYLKQEKLNSLKSQVSYVEQLNIQHEDGKWTCGDVECPAETTGCNIQIKSDKDDKKVLYQSFNCIGSISAGDKILLDKEKLVNIDIKSYVGAKRSFNLRYDDSDEEVAEGVVPVDKLQDLKKEFKELKRLVLEENRGTAGFSQG